MPSGPRNEEDWAQAHTASFQSFSFKSLPRSVIRSLRSIKAKDCGRFATSWLPILRWLPKYKPREYLFNDVLAGITNGIMNIPQGMAYGMLAGLDPAHGLYTSFFLPLLYSIFGTSKHVAMGTFAIVSLMNGQAVDEIVAGRIQGADNSSIPASTSQMNISSIYLWFCGQESDSNSSHLEIAKEVSGAITLTMGLIQIGLSLLRMGFLAVLLSDQLVQGLTSGAAIYVMTVQVKHLLGIESLQRPAGVFGLIKFYVCCFIHIGDSHLPTIITSFCCIVFLVFVKEVVDPKTRPKIKFPIPGELLVVIGTTLLFTFTSVGDYDVKTVGPIPTGLKPPIVPKLAPNLVDVITPAATIAIVLFSIECSLAKLFAKKHDYEIDPNQEFFALGAVHAIASFFRCHPGGSSLSRSMIQSNQGAKSQVPSIIAAIIVLCVLYFAAQLFHDLPKCCLASIIVVALKGMYKQIGNLRPLWSQSKIDFAIWLFTFLSVLLLGITWGLVAGLAFSVLSIVLRSILPSRGLLGSAEEVGPWREKRVWSSLRSPASVRVFRFAGPLYYANTEIFRDTLYAECGIRPFQLRKERRRAEKRRQSQENSVGGGRSKRSEDSPLRGSEGRSEVAAVVVDCSALSFLDVMGVEALRRLRADLASVDVRLLLANCQSQHLQLFQSNDLHKDIPCSDIFLSLPAAMDFASSLPAPATTASSISQHSKVL